MHTETQRHTFSLSCPRQQAPASLVPPIQMMTWNANPLWDHVTAGERVAPFKMGVRPLHTPNRCIPRGAKVELGEVDIGPGQEGSTGSFRRTKVMKTKPRDRCCRLRTTLLPWIKQRTSGGGWPTCGIPLVGIARTSFGCTRPRGPIAK